MSLIIVPVCIKEACRLHPRYAGAVPPCWTHGRQPNHPCYTFLRPGNDVKNLWNPEGWLGWLRYEEKWLAGFKTRNVAGKQATFPAFYETWEVHYHIHNSPPPVPYPSQINPFLCHTQFYWKGAACFFSGRAKDLSAPRYHNQFSSIYRVPEKGKQKILECRHFIIKISISL